MASEPSADALRRSRSDPTAFKSFYLEHVESLLAYFARRVFDTETALDLTAETFAQAYLGRRRFRGETDKEARGWLFGIASKQLALYFRRGAAERRALQKLSLEPPDLTGEEDRRLRELYELDDHRTAVRSAVEALSAPQREAVQLRVVDELPYAEIARHLEISEQAARARVARGLKALAIGLDQHPTLKEETP